jgi:O-antigen/teichoic acid export membrane protein
VLLNYLLIPKYKLNGAAFASGVGYFLTGIIFVIWFAKSNGIPINKMFILQQGDILNLKGE